MASRPIARWSRLHETAEFGHQQFQVTRQSPGAKWARFAVWDTAADGALTEPVRFDNANR